MGRKAHVVVLVGGNNLRVWENEFWNRSVSKVYDLGARRLPGDLDESPVTADRSTGILRDSTGKTFRTRYVLTDPVAQLVGQAVAADSKKQLALCGGSGPLRSSTADRPAGSPTRGRPRA